MIVTTARFATPHAAKYIAQLCKHFAHKVPAEWDAAQGRAALPSGPVTLRAEDGGLLVRIPAEDAKGMVRSRAGVGAEADALHVRITAEDAKAMIQSRFVVDSHLVTFAHREGFTGLCWQIEAG